MKKSIFLAAFGLATAAASSYGQGYVVFSSYLANFPAGATTSYYIGGGLVGIPFHAQLYYAFGTVSDPVNESSIVSITSPVGSQFTLLNGISAAYDNFGAATGTTGLGYFDYGLVTIPGYTGGPITFEVVAFSGSTWNDSISVGRSGAFTMDSIADLADPLPVDFGDNGQPMSNFLVWPGQAPEPTTLSLSGLGLGALLMAHRKQS